MSDFLRFSSAVGHPSHSFELTPLKPVWNNATPYPSQPSVRGLCSKVEHRATRTTCVHCHDSWGEVSSLGVGAVVFTLFCVRIRLPFCTIHPLTEEKSPTKWMALALEGGERATGVRGKSKKSHLQEKGNGTNGKKDSQRRIERQNKTRAQPTKPTR